MIFRLANINDLPQLKLVYEKIIQHMNENNIRIWDEIYPCEFFEEDIKNNRLYILEENNEIISAFALCDTNTGAEYIKWTGESKNVLYIDRLGVNINYARKGIGSIMLNKAIDTAKEKGAEWLRLFVVDINEPAVNLYMKSGFKKEEGIYKEIIDEDTVLHEFGFAIETSAP